MTYDLTPAESLYVEGVQQIFGKKINLVAIYVVTEGMEVNCIILVRLEERQ